MSSNKDRITELPEAILHHIIYFLHQLDESFINFNSVAHFSISSRAFYHACLSSPRLSYVQPKVDDAKKFIQCVDQSLEIVLTQGLTIDTFKLDIFDIKSENITRWVECVSPFKVKVMHLYFQEGCKFVVPMTLFYNITYLEELSLKHCLVKLREFSEFNKGVTEESAWHGVLKECTSREEGAVKFPCLKRLKLASVTMNTHSQTLAGIFRECPLLEYLQMMSMIIPSVRILGLPNLKSVVIGDDHMEQDFKIDIEAPCLREFSCKWKGWHMPSFSFSSWSGLKKLRLTGDHELSNLFLENLLTHLTQLEYLSISYCQGLDDPLISSPSIKHLKLVHCGISGILRIGCPNLCSFSYHCNKVPTIHQESSCSRHWRLDLYLYELGCQYHLHKDMFITDMRRFLNDTSINISCLRVDVSELNLMNKLPDFNEERMPENQVTTPWTQPVKLKWLKLELYNCECFPLGILDTFLRLSHPEFISFSFHGDHKDKVLQSMSDMLLKTKATLKCACSLGQELSMCWHHSLRDVKLEWLRISEGSTTERDFRSLDFEALHQDVMNLSYISDLKVCFRLSWQDQIQT